MLTIAERMRGSKQTLYNYFASKEELLRAVLDFDVGDVADEALAELGKGKSLRKGLARIGRRSTWTRQLAPLAISNIPDRRNPAGGIRDRRGFLPEYTLRGMEAVRRRASRLS